MQVRLWLDDVRDPARFGRVGWDWVKTYDEAIAAFEHYDVVEASLDHDLTVTQTLGGVDTEKTGYDLVCWMEEHFVLPRQGVTVHSANPSGAHRMAAGLRALCRRLEVSEQLVRVDPAYDVRSYKESRNLGWPSE
jgi:hypothetical protein